MRFLAKDTKSESFSYLKTVLDTVDVMDPHHLDVHLYVRRTVFTVYPVQEKYEQLDLLGEIVLVLPGNVLKVSFILILNLSKHI